MGELLKSIPGVALMVDDYGDRFAVGVTAEEVHRFHGSFDRIGSVRTRVPDKKIVKANVHVVGNPRRREDVRRLLSREFDAFDFVFPNPKAPLVDVLPKGWGKHRGVDYLRRELGLAPEEVVAFGDSMNDYAMLRFVGHPYVMGNARPALKQIACRVVGTNEEHAVQREMRRLLEDLS